MESVTIAPSPVATYLDAMETVIASVSRVDVESVVECLYVAWVARSTTFIVGNGGSASTASHMMNDLSKMTVVPGRPRFRAIALTDNAPILTAIANDLDYSEVFVEQLRNLFVAGDVLIVISGSGNSPNVVEAAKYAKAVGGFVVALCGLPGSTVCDFADIVVSAPSPIICQQEDVHLIVNHAVSLALRARLSTSEPLQL